MNDLNLFSFHYALLCTCHQVQLTLRHSNVLDIKNIYVVTRLPKIHQQCPLCQSVVKKDDQRSDFLCRVGEGVGFFGGDRLAREKVEKITHK